MQKVTLEDASTVKLDDPSIAGLDDPFTTKLSGAFVQDPENGESDVEAGDKKNDEKKKKPKKPNRRAGLGKKRGTGFEGKSDRRWVFAP